MIWAMMASPVITALFQLMGYDISPDYTTQVITKCPSHCLPPNYCVIDNMEKGVCYKH